MWTKLEQRNADPRGKASAIERIASGTLPAFATPAASNVVKSDEVSAAKKKGTKKSDLGSTELSAKKKSTKTDKKSEILYRIAA